MIYIIDHQDSFTHNVVHQFESFDNVVCNNYNEINENKLNNADVIVLSPGPGAPKNYPITSNIYKKFKGKKKIIGICLGFQQILYCEKGKIIEQNKIYHGYQSQIKVTSKKSLFKKNHKFKVGRYHSLKLKEPFTAKNFEITMRCAISNTAMAIENNKEKVYGFQFHPESFLTENGNLLIKKILSA
ncbi:anthranilate synthase component 2/para-aminobenzoate synthetase component 2 [Candidatus Pelagibacter ubique]|jgi:anthranilate synthase/aminodeoxychorismate synthase-like glutamine amidotransferase|uniref:Anthranilate synthase component 2/para-aminobenzoate synthetase component 2 n=1 Tax=Pelagibacter ubique TaxID=198252 RepID=A0ABX1T3N7_PELUQ|nr:aminodeoxychorismate/anthranilate synthase component II [Candidatus Pelagibacter ubique]NMN68176.1 anthranilate synthase component 2/para-aminobenzoate synthetase component 2 [Candidatus Pelagibacter ubique]